MTHANASKATGQHILVINRFDNESGRYSNYIDHRLHRVAYLTTAAGLAPLDGQQAETVVVVDDLADEPDVQAKAADIVDRFGPIDQVLALSEFDLELGASIRRSFGVRGPAPDDIAKVRDKVTMKSLVSAAGLPVPRFVIADSSDAVRSFVEKVGLPVILKPRRGWDSQGVLLVRSDRSLEDVLANADLTDYECEEFIDGQMYQVDGITQNGQVRLMRASRLLDTCLDFALGGPFGSVANDDLEVEGRILRFAQRVAVALNLGTSAFHLELFRTESDELVFLEIGARVGGAQIPYLWREVYGVDLHATWVRMLLGETMVLPRVDTTTEAGGYLLMPEPRVRPCRVTKSESLVDRIPEMYAEIMPAVGSLLDGTGGCRETSGRYRFRAPTAGQIERAIRQTVVEHRVDWEPVEAETVANRRSGGRAQSIALP